MYNYKLAPGVYNVGVLNPNMRVFDVIMETKNGTSYNSYIVRGEQKTALIDCVHKEYLSNLMYNIEGVEKDLHIDYLVMNHNEPDHSGSIAKLLDIFPDITVIASQAGAMFLKNITNRPDMTLQVVKDGDTLDLGGKTLEFINAPFLHWPDSMFSYLKEDKILFPCDFLGAHFCEPQMLDSMILYQNAYEEAFEVYYNAIFAPFTPHVRYGLDKIKNLDIAFAAPSHGPVLTKGIELEKAISKYTQWSAEKHRPNKLVPIFYCTAYGNTKMLAEHIAEGIRDTLPGAEVACYNIIEHDMSLLTALLNESDAFLVGSPTINRDAVPPVYMLLAHADAINMAKRPVAVFGSFGWSGEAAGNMQARLGALKTALYGEFLKINFVPTDEDLKKARDFGAAFAEQLK